MPFDASSPLSSEFREAIKKVITRFLDEQRPHLDAIGSEVRPLLDQARRYSSSGKRFRPAFVYWGYVAQAGQPADPGPLLRAAASLDLLHVSALAHDDVMDAAATRRGEPSAHVAFGRWHAASAWHGNADQFGRAAAILLGDLLLVWSAQMWSGSGFDAEALSRARPVLDAVRTEVTCGQFLDIVAQAEPVTPAQMLERARRVNEFKSARYTIARPVQLGAALAGASADLIDVLGQYGSPLGRAFQLRDDVLDLFGDASQIGKDPGGDLREGKRTVLLAETYAAASPEQVKWLDRLVGDPTVGQEALDQVRDLVTGTGALTRVEASIQANEEAALTALTSIAIDREARTALEELAAAAVRRDG